LPLFLLAASSVLLWAGCISGCKDEYDSAVASCKSQYDDPEDVDDLELCIQAAKDDYQSCIEECNESAGGGFQQSGGATGAGDLPHAYL
jgi:outer membrane murein-binding lipoprotein Lpp